MATLQFANACEDVAYGAYWNFKFFRARPPILVGPPGLHRKCRKHVSQQYVDLMHGFVSHVRAAGQNRQYALCAWIESYLRRDRVSNCCLQCVVGIGGQRSAR